MSRRKRNKSTKGQAGPAPKGAQRQGRQVAIPRNPRYDYLDVRDTPLTARGTKLIYDALGQTEAGRLWALVALHPCGEYVTSCDGIPDESMAAAVTPTYRANTTISWNPKLFSTAPSPEASFNYDIQLVTPPFPEIDYIYRLRYQGSWSRWVAVKLPSFSTYAAGNGVALGKLGMSKYRYMARGMTLYLDASRLADNGRYVGGQVATRLTTESMEWSQQSLIGSTGGDPKYGKGRTTVYGISVPPDEDQLVLEDNLAAQWPARDGAYIPHRFVSPVQQYIATEDGNDVATAPIRKSDGTVGAVEVPQTFLSIVKTDSEVPTIDSSMEFYHETKPTWIAPSGRSSLAPTRGIWGVSEPGNLYTGVSFFKAIAGTASVQVKSRVYLEAEAAHVSSAAAPFAHKPPQLDRVALDLVTKVAQVQPHVFYARDNDFSSILQSIGKILPGVLNWVQPLADKAAQSKLPFIAPFGQGIGAVTRGLSSAMDHFLQ